MHRRMAASAVTSPQHQIASVRDVADENFSRSQRARRLGVTFQTKIIVPLDKHLRIDRAVRLVASGAALAQRFVFERVRFGLLAVTLRAAFIEARHGQPAFRFHDVHSVRIVALDTIHLRFEDGMMLRQVKLGVRL